METSDIKLLVRTRYGSIAAADGEASCCAPAPAETAASSCCAPAAPANAKSLAMGYALGELAALPDGADLGLGCGNPQGIAGLTPGETVLDLGSGAGIDCFLAARQVGPEGRVIGVDMTHEMLAKARANARKMGATNVEFRLGEIEHLPIADATIDCAISNCVVNLVPDKAQVFRDVFRVLKPGGRIAISDVVNIQPLSAPLQADPTLLCGCIAGAVSAERVEAMLRDAGFTDISVEVKAESRDMVATWAPGLGIENHVAAAMIRARKPSAGHG